MALQCPYQHVSYATWRLQLIRSLFRVERESSAARFPFDPASQKRDYRTSQRPRNDKSDKDPSSLPSELDRPDDSTVKKSANPNPFGSEGIDRIQDALEELRLLRRQKTKRDPHPKQSLQKSQPVIYESPVKRILEKSHQKSHKRQPSREEKASLHDNLWARILATPIRSCFSSGTRLPIALLSDWNVVQEPKTEALYLMPTVLADLDGMEKSMADAMHKEAWKHEANPQQVPERSDVASEGGKVADSAEFDSVNEYVKPDKKANPVLSFAKSRIFVYVNYLRYLTTMLGKQRPLTATSQTKAVDYNAARLLHPKNREKFSLASHYERNRLDVAMKTGQIETPPPDSEHFKFQNLQWQPEIGERLTGILQKRIVVALRETTRVLNESDRKQHERRVLPLAIPKTGSFSVIKRHGFREALFAQLKAQLSQADGSKSKEDSTLSPAYPDFDELVEGPGYQAGQAPQTPPPWLAGSILLHIGRGDIEQLLSPKGKPISSSPYLPPLPNNNLIPPMIPVAGAYRLPVFSLHRLFAGPDDTRTGHQEVSADLEEVADIINTCPSFNFAWPPVMPTSPLYSPAGDAVLQGPQDFLVLIKSFPGGQKTLVEEIWRLWRYLGGRAYGQEPVFDDRSFRPDPRPENRLDPEVTAGKDRRVDPMRPAVQSAPTQAPKGGSQRRHATSPPQPPSRPSPSSSSSSSFGLTMSRKEFKIWLDDKYPAPPDALVRYEPLCR